MSALGKIFVFEQNTHHLHHFMGNLEAKGFMTFGSNNIYQFLRYAKEINPDIVIMNLPSDFNSDYNVWQELEQNLCHSGCPQIYINSSSPLENKPAFHYYNFDSSEIDEEQIMDIINQLPSQKYLH